MSLLKRFALASLCLFIINFSKAQFTTTWAFTSNVSGTKAGVSAASVDISDASISSSFTSNLGFSNNGVRCQPASGINWPTVATDGWHIDFPISPVGSIDASLLGLTFDARTSGSSGNNVVSLAIQKNGVGPFVPFSTPQNVTSGGSSVITFPAFNQKLYGGSGQTYIVRMYMYAAVANVSASRSLTVRNLVFNGTVAPLGTQPTVTTTSTANITKYTATANGTLTAGTYTILRSGVVWDINANPTIALNTKTTNGPVSTGNINNINGGAINGLSAGTSYNVRAYAESETGDVFYGANLTFTTLAPTVPELSTNLITAITSIKATSGGVIIDSGGVAITEKGVCWSTSPNPTILNNKTIDGFGNADYTSSIKILAPSTNYCVRAYAINSVGVGYGNERCFNTLAPEPVIITTTGNSNNSIPFGDVIVNNLSVVKTYNLSALSLTPLAGTVTINAPAGFQVSTNPSAGFSSSITITYTSASIASTIIYVRFAPNLFGAFSGTITHTGGGATATNIDNVLVTGNGIQNPSELSNTGTDFWVGYGFQSQMTGSNNQDMVLYISSKQDAIVTVEIGKPGDANYYQQTYNVLANVALATLPIPKNGVQDARLNSTGVSSRGIHVYSNGVPFSLWAHIYASQSSGATMVLPTNTWGANYSVLTVGGRTNSGVPHSFFFVQAAEDNTIVDIVPSADITENASGTTIFRPAGVMFSVSLNKGEVFNALGKLTSSTVGVDLTGSTVSSKDCNKKIALFTGNGRVLLGTSICTPSDGSDNFIQQMFPRQAWGTKYVTSPFRDMEMGFYKIIVNNPATVVTVNGNPLTGLVQNAYTFETDTLLNIEADQPVMVAQFLMSHDCGAGSNTPASASGRNGDPEMVILSPVQQAIEEVTFYSTNNFAVTRNLVNVVIPNDGVSSFTLDGVNVSGAFSPHTGDNKYSYAVFDNLTGNASHTLKSKLPFTAMAYGWKNNDHESYGYNAGTNLRPLTQFLSVNNTYPSLISQDTVIPTCINNPFQYKVFLPYKPLSMHWNFLGNASQLPNADTVLVNNPVAADSITVNGTKLYRFELPTQYTFNSTGSYPVNITVNATNADGCNGLQKVAFTIKVVDPPTPKVALDYFPCLPTIVNYTDSSYDSSGYRTVGREWTFNGLSPVLTSTNATPTVSYSLGGNYNVQFRTINSIGCYKDTSFTLVLYNGPLVDSIVSDKENTCTNNAITFTAYASTSLGTIATYYWDFGDGTKDTTTTNTNTHIYAVANATGYDVKVYVVSSAGCESGMKSIVQKVYLLKADFTLTTPQCVNSNVSFTDASQGTNVASPLSVQWLWTLDGINTSTTPSPNFTYNTAGNYSIKQKVSLSFGGNVICFDSVAKPLVITPVLVLNNITASNSNYVCTNKSVTFTANGTTSVGTIKWYWNWSDGRKDTTTTNTITRSFTTQGAVTVDVFAKINDGCPSNTVSNTQNVFNLIAANNITSPQCVNSNVAFNDNSTGVTFTSIVDTKWQWSFGDNANSTANTQNASFTYSTANTYSVKMRVSLLAGLVEFCADSITKPLVINATLEKPKVTVDATKTTTNSLTFNWNPVANATGYQVSDNGGLWTIPSTGNNGLQHVLNSLLPNTQHTVCVKPLGSCLGDTACATAKTTEPNTEIFIPNTFTPNGDGKNDKIVVCSNTINSVKFVVFSQYGEKLYEGNSANNVNNCFEMWDGNAFGKMQPVGVYAYIATITMKDGKVVNRKGLINLIK
jgi:gliding motility-associated-like protein